MYPLFETIEPRRFLSASIAGKVFNDANANGKLGSGEGGVGGVTVYIDSNNNGHHNSGEPTKVTAGDGSYKFSNLTKGTYHIRQLIPGGYRQTLPSSGGLKVSLGSSSTKKTGVNFGDTKKVRISGFVYNDTNGNGKQDSGEKTLAGVDTYINTTAAGTFNFGDPEHFTDSKGNFVFDNLQAGKYNVGFINEGIFSPYVNTQPKSGHYTLTLSSGQTKDGLAIGIRPIVVLNSSTRKVTATGGSVNKSSTSTTTGTFNKTVHAADPSFGDAATSTLNSELSAPSLSFSGSMFADGSHDLSSASVNVDTVFTVNYATDFNLNYSIHGNRFQLSLKNLGNGKNVITPVGEDPNNSTSSLPGSDISLAAGKYEFHFTGSTDTSGSPFFLSDFNVGFGVI